MVKGEEVAYRMFYEAYSDRLARYLWVATRGNETAMREALQATLMRVVKNIRMFSSEEIFWSWLTVLARSALRDESKKQRRYLSFLDRFRRHGELDTKTTDSSEIDFEEKMKAVLDRAVAALPADEQALLISRYFIQKPVRAIADSAQTTDKAVQSKLARIRKKLKESILAQLKND